MIDGLCISLELDHTAMYTCCISPDLYPVVYRFKLSQIEMINREYSCLPTGWVWRAKNISHAILETPPPFSPAGGGGWGV